MRSDLVMVRSPWGGRSSVSLDRRMLQGFAGAMRYAQKAVVSSWSCLLSR